MPRVKKLINTIHQAALLQALHQTMTAVITFHVSNREEEAIKMTQMLLLHLRRKLTKSLTPALMKTTTISMRLW